MPTFSTQPSTGIADSVRNLVSTLGGGNLNAKDLMAADHAGLQAGHLLSQTQHQSSLAEKVRLEVEQMRKAAADRENPALATEYGARAAGIDLPAATQLEKAVSGVRERPMASVDDEGNSMPDVTYARPEGVTPQQTNLYQAARAALLGNRLATGKTNADELAKAGGHIQGQGITAAVQAALANGKTMDASAMNQGGVLGHEIKLYDNVGSTGATFAPSTGAVQADPNANPSNQLLVSTLKKAAADAAHQNAAAGASAAAADNSRANAARTRDMMGREQKGTYDPVRGILVNPVDGTSRDVVGADGQPIGAKQTPEKALPPSAAQKLIENNQNLRRAQQALALISGKDIVNETGDVIAKGDKQATGYKGYVPEAILQRTDKAGIDARAALGDLGSLIIHERSGAAVTASEYPRLRPFIPLVTDDPDTVKKKLTKFANEYQKVVDETADFYRESGYKVPKETLKGAGVSDGGKKAYSQEDLEFTAKKRGMTVEQVKKKLGID